MSSPEEEEKQRKK